MRKRLLSIILSLCMIMTMLPVYALADGEQNSSNQTIQLQYDDYNKLNGQVSLLDAGINTAADGAVLELSGSTIHAIGLGTAKVSIDGTEYTVTVEKAKVNIILVAGQSNATGEYNGNEHADKQNSFDVAPAECEKGTAYLWSKNAERPVYLTGMAGKGWRSSLAKELYAETNIKTAIVYDNPLTARPGANITEWTDDNTTSNPDVNISAQMVQSCYNYFNQSAYYDVNSCGMYWLQGEANASNNADYYYTAFMNMYNTLKANSPIAYCAFFRVRRTTQLGIDYMGPVVAQFQMTNDNADMFMASTLTENWVEADYNTPITVDTSNYLSISGNSSTPEYYKLFGGVHYYQLGYNIIGADAAYHMTQSNSSEPQNKIVMGDTTGQNNQVLDLGSKLTKTKDETSAMTKGLMFYAAPGSQAATVDISVISDESDITNRVVASSGGSAYLVNMAALKLCKDPVVTATMKSSTGDELGNVQIQFTTGVAVNPEPSEDSNTGIYYHWDFTDKSAYTAGIAEDGSTQQGTSMQIKTAADSVSQGYLMYQGNNNEALSFSNTDGLVRGNDIRSDTATEYKNAFVIHNNTMGQGITVTPGNGFLIEFTAKSLNTHGIVLGTGSNFANSGHPLLYFNADVMSIYSQPWKINAANAGAFRNILCTYRYLFDGQKLHLTVTDANTHEVYFDKDITIDGTLSDWNLNYLFPAFSTDGHEKSYLFTGNITDLKIATDAYKTLTITDESGIENTFTVNGVSNRQKIPTFEDTTFSITTADSAELANVTATNAKLTYNPDTLTYTLSNISGDVTLNVQTQLNYHNWIEVSRIEPTCIENGSVSYRCSDEGCLATKTEILLALGHKWDSGTVIVEPTNDASGTLRYTCKTCGETRDETIPANSNYYHWDFSDKSSYVSGLNEDGTTADSTQMKIKSAADSPELYWVYSEAEKDTWRTNDNLKYSQDKGLSRLGNQPITNSFKLKDSSGDDASINMTTANGFKLEAQIEFPVGNSYGFVLNPKDLNNAPWFYLNNDGNLRLGNYQNYIQFNIRNSTAGQMATYTYTYNGHDTYHIRVAQGESIVYDEDIAFEGTPYENYSWKVLMPTFSGVNNSFNASIKDLKIWTNTNYDVKVTAEHATTNIEGTATIAADGSLSFTVTPDEGYHIMSVAADNGVVLQNDDGSYKLAYVSRNTTIKIAAEQHTWKWSHDDAQHWQACSGCNEAKGKESHVWDDGIITKSASCTEKGVKMYTCATCKATRTEDIAALGHNMVKTEAKAATYAEAGNHEYYTCSVCHKVFKDSEGTTETTIEAETIAKLTSSSSSGSSHSSSSTTNTVSAPSASNGKVSLDKSSAKKGDKVTITITPDEGYKLDKLTVTDAKGKTIAVTKNSDNKYTFTMPDSKVSVDVSYIKADATTEQPSDSKNFIDVSSSDWYTDAVQYVTEKGLMNGTGDSKFSPADSTTRGMLMTILARYAGEDTTGGATWYEKGMNWAKANGVSDGTNPNANITREQLVTMLYRYAGSPATNGALTGFSDAANVSNYAVTAMQWAVANGIVNGSNGKLNPQDNATRAEVAAILMRFCEMSK